MFASSILDFNKTQFYKLRQIRMNEFYISFRTVAVRVRVDVESRRRFHFAPPHTFLTNHTIYLQSCDCLTQGSGLFAAIRRQSVYKEQNVVTVFRQTIIGCKTLDAAYRCAGKPYSCFLTRPVLKNKIKSQNINISKS
jgi:hypothetical protein